MQQKFSCMLDEIEAAALKVHGIEVYHGGEVLRHMFSADIRYPIYSATKTVTSLAVCFALAEGRISLTQPLAELLPQRYLWQMPQQRRAAFSQLPLERFLTMSVAGYPFRPDGSDWLEFALACPVDLAAEPRFDYSNISAYLAGAACEHAVGEHLIAYLTPRLFEPLGIISPDHSDAPQGGFYGASGMKLSLHEMSQLGLLLMNGGRYNNMQLLPESIVRSACTKKIDCNKGGYGYFIWVYENSFAISGKWGQRCEIFPQKQLMTAYLGDMPNTSRQMETLAKRFAERI